MQGQAILFINIDHNDQFQLTQQGAQVLEKVKNKRVSIISISGPQRSGKSFLANRILNQMQGFQIGPTVNPCTKGIWIWNEPILQSDNSAILVMDTEGLFSTQRNATLDSKIFSLSILISSLFIYNQLGHIDEKSIENMSLVVDLGKNIQLDKQNSRFRIKDYSPNFIWVLRDFSLDLKNMSQNQYLEQALQQVKCKSQEDQAKNVIRDKIKSYFQNIECHCLIRPLSDETMLTQIQNQPWNTLRPQFREQCQNLEKRIIQLAKPKTIQFTELNGQMYLSLIQSYIQKMNNNQIPEILTSLNIVKEQEFRRIRNALEDEFKIQIKNNLSIDHMPFDQDYLIMKQQQILNYILDHLEKSFRNVLDWNQMIDLKLQLKDYFQILQKQIDQTNKEKSLQLCSKLVSEFRNQQQMPSLNQIQDPIQNYQETVNKFVEIYQQQAKGPFKYEIMTKNIFQIIFKQFRNYEIDFKNKINDENQKQNLIDKNKGDTEKRLKKQIKEYEQYIEELNIEQSKLFKDLQIVRDERNKIQQNFENYKKTNQQNDQSKNIESLLQINEQLEKDNKNFKEKLLYLEQQFNEAQSQSEDLQNILNKIKTQEIQQSILIDAHETMHGLGVPQQISKALAQYEKLANQNNINALNCLANLYYDKKIFQQNIPKSQQYAEKSIQLGSAQGWYMLGLLFENKLISNSQEFLSIHQNCSQIKKAIICYETAAQQDHLDALSDLGFLYEQGLGDDLQQNKQMAMQYHKKAADKNFPRAMNNLGLFYVNNDKDQQEALKLISKSAQMFYTKALYNLGLCYHDGLGTEKDQDKANSLFKKAEKRGDIDAKLALTYKIIEKESTEEEYEKAFQNLILIQQSKMNPDIQYYLGYQYQYGLGINQDLKMALKYYLIAANKNHAKSLNKCGDFYSSGSGLKQPDKNQATKYYAKAAKLGDIEALLNLGALFEENQKLDKALEIYQTVAKQENSWGYLNIAIILMQTNGSKSEIKYNIQKAAQLGNAKAQNLLQNYE